MALNEGNQTLALVETNDKHGVGKVMNAGDERRLVLKIPWHTSGLFTRRALSTARCLVPPSELRFPPTAVQVHTHANDVAHVEATEELVNSRELISGVYFQNPPFTACHMDQNPKCA